MGALPLAFGIGLAIASVMSLLDAYSDEVIIIIIIIQILLFLPLALHSRLSVCFSSFFYLKTPSLSPFLGGENNRFNLLLYCHSS